MKKLLLTSVLFITACSSTPKIDRSHITETTSYNINRVNIVLDSRCPSNNYPDKKELDKLFKEQITEVFCSKNRCTSSATKEADIVHINLDANYKRVFMGEAFSCNESYGSNSISYKFSLIKNDNKFFETNYTKELVTNHGFFGNLKKIGSQLSMSGDKENEAKDIRIITNAIAENITQNLK